MKAIPYFDNQEFCPVVTLKKFINYKTNTNKQEKVFKISDKSVALIIKKYATKAGLDSTKYAGHSLRSVLQRLLLSLEQKKEILWQ